MRSTFIVLLTVGLGGCADGGMWSPPAAKSRANQLIFSAPYGGQKAVPTGGRIYVQLAQEVGPQQLELVDGAGGKVAAEVILDEDKQGARLVPAAKLRAASRYGVRFDGASVMEFETAPEGSRKGDGLKVLSVDPIDLPVKTAWDFSTFRVIFSEPVDPYTVTPESFRLERVTAGLSVASAIRVTGVRALLDPVADLKPGEKYRLVLTEEIRDLAGEPLTAASFEVTIADSGPRQTMGLALDSNAPRSLGGMAPNALILNSRLVGEQRLVMSGALITELPDLSVHSELIPIVVRKGQRLPVLTADGKGLEIRLGGAIDTGLRSGPLSLTVVADATGYIQSNPSKGGAPRVFLSLDSVLSATDPKVQAILNQDVPDLRLSGLMKVNGSDLSIELTGDAEISLLGMETASAAVSVRARSAKAVPNPWPEAPLKLVASYPNDAEEDVPLDAAASLIFDRPIGREAIDGKLWLEREGGDGLLGTGDDLPFKLAISGATATVSPKAPLAAGAGYRLRVSPELTDVGGKALAAEVLVGIAARPSHPGAPQGPLLETLNPGLPCVLMAASMLAGVAGEHRCSVDAPPAPAPFRLPANGAIGAWFSKPINPQLAGKGFEVTEVEGDKPVPGVLRVRSEQISFIPNHGWEVDKAYQVRIEGIRDLDGLPLNTDLLLDNAETAGGPPIVLPFVGGEPTHDVTLPLRLAPFADTNGNGILDLDRLPEKARLENSVVLRELDNQYVATTYLSGSLLTEVGAFDPATQTMEVRLGRGSWIYGTHADILGAPSDRLIIQPVGASRGTLEAPAASDPDKRPLVKLPMVAMMSSVDDSIQATLQKEPVVIPFVGRLDFTSDGRLVIALQNDKVVQLAMLRGRLVVKMNPGEVRVRTVTPPVH
jgi:hypothetical protein